VAGLSVVTKKDKYLAAAQKFLERGILDKAGFQNTDSDTPHLP